MSVILVAIKKPCHLRGRKIKLIRSPALGLSQICNRCGVLRLGVCSPHVCAPHRVTRLNVVRCGVSPEPKSSNRLCANAFHVHAVSFKERVRRLWIQRQSAESSDCRCKDQCNSSFSCTMHPAFLNIRMPPDHGSFLSQSLEVAPP